MTFVSRILNRVRAGLPKMVGVAALLVVAGACLQLLFPDLFRSAMPRTFGSIYVNSPQIYTRERLVNDRFVHDAWLRQQLDLSDTLAIGPTERVHQDVQLKAMAGAGKSGGAGPAAQPVPDASPQDPAPAPAASLGLSPLDVFEARNSYRAQVRGQIIENQLDDRHDLQGNSLYLFKFDVAIVPGDNTTSSARITIEMKGVPYYSAGESAAGSSYDAAELTKDADGIKKYARDYLENQPGLDVWKHLYSDWWHNIGTRLNATVSELLKAYRNDRFPLEYYREIFWSIVSSKKFADPTSTDQLLACLESVWGDESVAPGIKHREIRRMIGRLETIGDVGELKGAGDEGREQLGDQASDSSFLNQIEPRAASLCQTLVSDGVSSRTANSPAETEVAERTVIEFAARKASEIVLGADTRIYIEGLSRNKEESLGIKNSPPPGSLDPYIRILFQKGESLDNPGSFIVYDRSAMIRMEPVQKDAMCRRPEDGTESYLLFKHKSKNGAFCVTLPGMKDTRGQPLAQVAYYEITENLADAILKALSKFSPSNEEKIYNYPVPTGLFSFIEAISRVDTYSYSVTPKREYEVGMLESSVSSVIGGDVPAASISASAKRHLDAIRENVAIVSFGSAPIGDKTASTTFGWVFSPTSTDEYDGRRKFSPVQHSVYALLSVPAWWSKVQFTVNKAWTDDAGRPVDTKQWALASDVAPETVPQQAYTIPLPVDYEAIDLIVLGATRRSPEVYGIGLEQPIRVAACRAADILLPGKRLWRSTIVTLGGQVADRITVLPSMRGIIAHFGEVEIPPALTNPSKESKLPVTIWTSEGQYTLPSEAVVVIPGEIQQQMKAAHLSDCPASAGPSMATAQ
jgi:hypothetical protein